MPGTRLQLERLTFMGENCEKKTEALAYSYWLFAITDTGLRVIRPRDKPAYMKHNVNGNMHDRARDFEGYEKVRSRFFQGTDRRFENRGSLIDLPMGFPMSPGQMQTPTVAPPAEMLSKILTVANLPADMSPKELYDLFASYGSVERSFIFPQADALGRRFGEVTMASFFFAQKVHDAFSYKRNQVG